MATQEEQPEMFKPQDDGKAVSTENGKKPGESQRSSARFANAVEPGASAKETAALLQIGQQTAYLTNEEKSGGMERIRDSYLLSENQTSYDANSPIRQRPGQAEFQHSAEQLIPQQQPSHSQKQQQQQDTRGEYGTLESEASVKDARNSKQNMSSFLINQRPVGGTFGKGLLQPIFSNNSQDSRQRVQVHSKAANQEGSVRHIELANSESKALESIIGYQSHQIPTTLASAGNGYSKPGSSETRHQSSLLVTVNQNSNARRSTMETLGNWNVQQHRQANLAANQGSLERFHSQQSQEVVMPEIKNAYPQQQHSKQPTSISNDRRQWAAETYHNTAPDDFQRFQQPRGASESYKSPTVNREAIKQPRYTQVSNQVKRKGGAFKGTKFSVQHPGKKNSQVPMLQPGNVDIMPNASRAVSNNHMKTLQNDMSFDRNFAQTTFKLKDQESNSLEALQKRVSQVGSSQDLKSGSSLMKGSKGGRDSSKPMKSLLTNYQQESPSAQKTSMYIMEAGSQRTLNLQQIHEKSAKSINVKHRTSVGVSEMTSTRKFKSPKHPNQQETQSDAYITNLEGEVKNLRESLRKAKEETKQMKRINKDLLEDLNMKQRTVTEGPPDTPQTQDKSAMKGQSEVTHLLEDSILDGLTQKSRAEGEKTTRRNQVNTAKVSFRHKSVQQKQTTQQDASKIHSLYQDLYLTDLKNDVGELEEDLSKEKEKNLQLTQQLNKCKKELANHKRTIANYRKAVTDMQKDFFKGGGGGGPPSSITMTSVGRLSGMKRDVSAAEEMTVAGATDDVISTTSGLQERQLKESATKVQQYLESNNRSQKSSSQLRSGAALGARAIRVNYNSACDLERFERFKSVVMNVANCRKLAKLCSIVIRELQLVIPCSSCAVFVFTPGLFKSKQLLDFQLFMQKSFIDGKYIDVIGKADSQMADPQFKKMKEALNPVRQTEYMTQPIFSAGGELSLNIQLLSRKKRNTKFATGFTNIDEVLLQIFAAVVQAKLQQIQATVLQKKIQKEVVTTIGAASVICTQRSYHDFIMNCRKVLPQFFGFEGIGILFRDHETNNLFSIETDDLEGEQEQVKNKEQKKAKQIALTQEEELKDMGRQYRRRSQHVYPNSLGVTGQAFSTGEIIHCNKMAKLQGFLPSIDNLSTNVKDVHSIMIVPIYGHRDKVERNTKKLANKKKEPAKLQPIAILQFINKVDFKQIDQYDIDKIGAMSDLLGMSIDNASEHHSVINVTVGVQENFANMAKFTEMQNAIAEEQRETLNAVPMYQIRQEYNKLYNQLLNLKTTPGGFVPAPTATTQDTSSTAQQ